MPPTSIPLVPEARTALAKVPLTPDEKLRWQAEAAAEGRSLAEHIRLRYEAEAVEVALTDSVVDEGIVITRSERMP